MLDISMPADSGGHRVRVLFIADVPVTGGATESLVQLLTDLRERHSIDPIVCTTQRSELNARLESLGIATVVTGHRQFLYSPPPITLLKPFKITAAFLLYKARQKTSLARVQEQVDLETIDLIHSNLPRTDLGELVSHQAQIPHICHLREFSFDDFQCVSFRKDPARFLTNNSAALIAVSNAVKEAWVARGADKDKIHVIYNGINLSSASSGQHTPSFSPSELGAARCVFLGGCSEAKGVWVAIRAIEYLSRSMPITLDIFGGDSRTTVAKVHAYVRLKRLTSIIRIHDRDPYIHTKLQHYNLGLVCSKAEAFGRVIVEYQAAGIPVIGANTGAIPELIDDQKNGYLYDRATGFRGLSERIRYVYSNPTSWHSVQQHGLRAASRFSSESNAQQIANLYNQVLQDQLKETR